MNATRWCLRLLGLVLLTTLWHSSLAAPIAYKATIPPPTAIRIDTAELDTLSYLAGASAAVTLKHQSSTMGFTDEQLPLAIAGFRQYWNERSTPQRLAYNTGLMIVPEVIDLLRKVEEHLSDSNTINQLSLPDFAQGIEEAHQSPPTLPAPEAELEQWVEGQLAALKNNYTTERAEQISYILGRVAINAGYISTIVGNYGADTTYISDAIDGITQGLRANTPSDIARYMGLRLGQQGWEAFTSTEVALLGDATTRDHITHLSPEFYLRGFTEVYKGTLSFTDAQGRPLSAEACETLFFERLERHYLIRYKQAQRKAKAFWQQLREDSAVVWLDEYTAYRIASVGSGNKPTPNQRITASITPLDSLLRPIETKQPVKADTLFLKPIQNSRLNTIPQPLRSVLSTLALGSSITWYIYNTATDNIITPENLSADLPQFFAIFRIDTQQTSASKRTTKAKTTSKKKTTARQKTTRRRR